MKREVKNTIGTILMIFGVLLLIGTAGALELDRITITQAAQQALVGLGITTLGGCLFKITYERDTYTYYKEDNHE